MSDDKEDNMRIIKDKFNAVFLEHQILIWNTAIEAAAKVADEVFECGIAEDIRELKK